MSTKDVHNRKVSSVIHFPFIFLLSFSAVQTILRRKWNIPSSEFDTLLRPHYLLEMDPVTFPYITRKKIKMAEIVLRVHAEKPLSISFWSQIRLL